MVVIKIEFALCTILALYCRAQSYTSQTLGKTKRSDIFTMGEKCLLSFLTYNSSTSQGRISCTAKRCQVFIHRQTILLALALISPTVLAVFLVQAVVAVFLLEFVNYLQHHGLTRGEDERPNASHAWEAAPMV